MEAGILLASITCLEDIMSNNDEYTIPLSLWPDANRLAADPVEYHDSWYRFEILSNIQLRNSDTVVVSGYGVHLKVEYDSLVAEYEQAHVPGRKKLLRLDRGVHKMKQIFIASHGGYVSFEAAEWCTQQDITVIILNWRNDIVQVLTPRQNRNARLVYLQYKASESEQSVEIARELVRCKTERQIVAIKYLVDHPVVRYSMSLRKARRKARRPSEVEYGDWQQFEDGIESLVSLEDVESIRLLEGRLAKDYWSLMVGMPVQWDYSAMGKIPEHWLKVPERVSGISSSGNASQATNPFHATLNFAYALLKAQVLQSILIHGLDETIGFLHASREGGQPFVYDLMEPFRSLIDMSVLDIFDRMIFKKGDFIQTTSGECQLNEGLRRYVVTKCRVPNRDIDQFVEQVMDIICRR